MDIPNHAQLLTTIEGFCRRHNMAETRFGRESVKNPNFIAGLRREPPVSPTLDTLGKVKDFMARVDSDAKLKAPAPLELMAQEEELALPFAIAPAGAASSQTCSSTTAPPTSSAANASCPVCSPAGTDAPLQAPARSCSATDRETAK